jgi:hypothetical protein
MQTLGGGWTVIQRRGVFPAGPNPPDYFLKNWTDYEVGLNRYQLKALKNVVVYNFHFLSMGFLTFLSIQFYFLERIWLRH